ncbi:MAG: YdcF family protein [Pseudomonadota bacterium]
MSFFEISKIFGLLIDPLNSIFLLSFIAALLLWLGKHRAARALSTFIVAIFVVILVFPIGDLLLIPLEERFPPPNPWPTKVDGIIMLGGSQIPLLTHAHGQPALNGHAERMTTFLALARRYPDAKLVFSGGAGDMRQQNIKESETVKLFLTQQGFDADRVIYESKSRNTYENVIFSQEMVKPKNDETWLLITSAASIPRAVGLFQKVGWPVVAAPCSYKSLKPSLVPSLNLSESISSIQYATHEWIGLAVYYMTGKTQSLFPKS